MTPERVKEVISFYRQRLEVFGATPIRFPSDRPLTKDTDALEHCHWMLDRMEEFLEQGQLEKAFRWLGFIQGCLWSVGWFTVDELRHHNSPHPAR